MVEIIMRLRCPWCSEYFTEGIVCEHCHKELDITSTMQCWTCRNYAFKCECSHYCPCQTDEKYPDCECCCHQELLWDHERYWKLEGRLCFGPDSGTSAYCQLCASCWKELDFQGDGSTFYKGKDYHHECANKIMDKAHEEYVKAVLASPERCQYQLLQFQRREKEDD